MKAKPGIRAITQTRMTERYVAEAALSDHVPDCFSGCLRVGIVAWQGRESLSIPAGHLSSPEIRAT